MLTSHTLYTNRIWENNHHNMQEIGHDAGQYELKCHVYSNDCCVVNCVTGGLY